MRFHILAGVLLLLFSNYTQAKNLYVDPSDAACDDHVGTPFCSLSAALTKANNNDVLHLAKGDYPGKVLLNKNVKIQGKSKDLTRLNAKNNGTTVTIAPGVKASLSDIAIINGHGKRGGGILNQGSLMLSNCRVADNISLTSGGGIYNANSVSGSLLIDNCLIENNHALGDDPYNVKYGGGGIYNHAPMHISITTIQNNFAEGNGGGLYSIYSGRKKPTEGQIYTEKLGIATASRKRTSLHRPIQEGSVQIKSSQIQNNTSEAGGGIYIKGVLLVRDSVIDGNNATNGKRSAGGGIFAHLDTLLAIDNSIISHNTATFRGGGVRFYSVKQGQLNNVTIIDNQILSQFGHGAGVLTIKGSKTLQLHNTVVANNLIAGKTPVDCQGSIHSLGFNFLGSQKNCEWQISTGDIIAGEGEVLDPFIHWNQSQTRYLIANSSPVIDSADPKGCIDSNGQPIHKDLYQNPRATEVFTNNHSRCDIGAIEYFSNRKLN